MAWAYLTSNPVTARPISIRWISGVPPAGCCGGAVAEDARCPRPGALPGLWLLPGRAVLARTVHGLDAGEDEIDAGEELLAVVVFAQLRPGSVHGWVFSGVASSAGDWFEK